MPSRAIPAWMREILDQPASREYNENVRRTDELLELLTLVKRGVRNRKSIAIKLSVDRQYAVDLINHAINHGLLTSQVYLTPTGKDKLAQLRKKSMVPKRDRKLYIPTSWCADQVTVQPLTDKKWSADSAEPSVEGGV